MAFFSDGYIQPYGDTPVDNEIVGENIYLNMINKAKHYVYITTPYLIIDNEMVTALTLAAKSGIDVRIITPGIPDKKLVYLVTQSYYYQLIEAGVRIFQYTPGFIHAKTVVVDDKVATVRSTSITGVCICILSVVYGCLIAAQFMRSRKIIWTHWRSVMK